MNLHYHKWMELKVTNNYFQEGMCSDFDVIPFKDTSHKMRNYEVLMKKESNTFSWYAGTKETFTVAALDGLEDLYFQLINSDSLFFNYTDIPLIAENQLYYFHNNANSDSPQLFQKSQFVNKQDVIGIKSKQFNVMLPNNNEVVLEIKNSDDSVVVNTTLDGTKVNNYALSLAQYDNGVYQLWLNNQLQETFFMSNEGVAENCIGIVKLNVKDIIARYPTVEYSIDFTARSVYWQYQVVVPKSRKIQVINMNVSGVNNEEYQGPENQEIIGGQTAQVFTTSAPILLQNVLKENPQLQVTYSNDFSNRKNQLEINLPNPDAEQIKKYNQGENENSFISSTIVYV